MTPAQIISAVAERIGVSPTQIVGAARTKRITYARHVAMYLVRGAGFSYPEVAQFFGNRDHTTVLHAVRKITNLCASNAEAWAEVEALRCAS